MVFCTWLFIDCNLTATEPKLNHNHIISVDLVMTCDDTSQMAAQVVTNSALSLYKLTFHRRCISYDSSLKRCLKDTFLLLLLTFYLFGLGWFGFPTCTWFATMFNFDTKDFYQLVSQISHKIAEATTSWQSNKLKTCDDLHSRFIMALSYVYTLRLIGPI